MRLRALLCATALAAGRLMATAMDGGGDIPSDHADCADARLTCTGGAT